jgi:hypothetical protein
MKRLLIAALALSGCSNDAAPPPGEGPTSPLNPEKIAADCMRFDAPASWVREEPSNRLRRAQFRVPDKEKQEKDADMIVSYLGNRPRPIDEDVDRWSAQMGGAEGKTEKIEGKCKATLVDFSGTYAGDGGTGAIPNARLLIAVVEAPDGPWYYKLVGPVETVSDWRDEFVALLKSAQR